MWTTIKLEETKDSVQETEDRLETEHGRHKDKAISVNIQKNIQSTLTFRMQCSVTTEAFFILGFTLHRKLQINTDKPSRRV